MSDYSNIANYIFKEDIGEGNIGKVKLGIFKQTGEEFAIKILNKEKIKIKMKNTVFKENEIITKFNHVNVIFVFDIIEDSDNYYIVMEYCKSGELFDYIVDKQHLDEDEASIFFYQLINGVQYIHSLGVAHRDLKPENLLLTEKKILKIIDFGLSHEFNGEDFLKTKCGSPSYAAPEIIKGLPYDGFKTDIWCCGIILYAMVCGYLPFEGENNKILFRNIVECKPEIPDNLSEETQDLISAILMPDPNDRITIDEIKKHEFYLRGKELCDIDYPKLQRMLNRKRQNMSNNNFNMNNNIDKGIDDIEFINQKINITIDNDENLQYDEIMKINKNNSNKNKENKKSKEITEDNIKTENNDIIIKSFNEISVSKMTNNSKYDNNNINTTTNNTNTNTNTNNNYPNNKEIIIVKEEEEKNGEPRRHFKFLNKRGGLNAFRDKIFSLDKNINKKIENFNNNMHLILNTDANFIVNNKLKKIPLYNNQINTNTNNKNINTNNNNDFDTNTNNKNINTNTNNDFETNTNNINTANTVSSTIHGNQKNIYANSITNNNGRNIINSKDINQFINNKKNSLYLDNLSCSSKNRKIKIQERDKDKNKNKITPRKFKANNNNFLLFKNINNINVKNSDNSKYKVLNNGFNPKIKKNNFENNIIKLKHNNMNNNNINIINNINNTINNYGILNILPSATNNNSKNVLYNNKKKIFTDKIEKFKTEGNTFNAIKEMIYNNKKRPNSGYRIEKLSQYHKNKYLNNITKDYHSTKSSNSNSTKNRSNLGSNSKNKKNKKAKNPINILGNSRSKGYIIKGNDLNKKNNSKINNSKNIQYPSLNIGNKLLFQDKNNSNNKAHNYNNLINNNYNNFLSINNSKRNKQFNQREKNSNEWKDKKKEISKNSVEKIKKNKKECINYFNALSTMFMKTENNFHKNKFKNSNTNSVNSRISKNSKNSKTSKNSVNSKANSKNSKSSKSSKSSTKKYNLIRNAIKNQMNNFIFNKKGGSEGKTNRFLQHSKLFNINSLRNNNNYNNINNILNNCMGINNNDIKNNNNKNNEVNNIKIIRQKRNDKNKKYIYNQINFETIKNFYDLNSKKK